MVGEMPAFDVSGAVAVLNQALEYALPTMVIVGELDSFKVSKGKWVYADIKDASAKLRMFGTVYMLPGPLEDGMMIEVVARPQIHNQYGFSLQMQSIRPVGEGSLKKAAHLLQAKLQAEGLFDEDRKRDVPYPPQRVGLVTSAESAAYADFTKILNARWQGVVVDVYDSRVQGESAVESLVAGVQYFNQHALPPDVVVLIRGGGSADDLSVFSAEQVVRAVAGSRIPTCVAIGHEIDESLCELAADMRASTPSNAAELLFPDKKDELRRLTMIRERLRDTLKNYMHTKEQELHSTRENLAMSVEKILDVKLQNLSHAKTLLEAVHPKNTLKRGYALVQDKDGKLVSSVNQTKKDERLKITFADGDIETIVN